MGGRGDKDKSEILDNKFINIRQLADNGLSELCCPTMHAKK